MKIMRIKWHLNCLWMVLLANLLLTKPYQAQAVSYIPKAILNLKTELEKETNQEVISDDVTSQEDKSKTERSFNAEVHDIDLLESHGIEPLEIDQYQSLQEVIWQLIEDYGVNTDQIGLAYYDIQTGEEFQINAQEEFIVASISKAPMAAIYIDLINQGYYNWQSPIPYDDTYNAEEDDATTYQPSSKTYPLYDLIYTSIVNSDNGAAHAVTYNYINNFGNVRTALLDFADYWAVSDQFYQDNYGSAEFLEATFKKIALDPNYEEMVEMMMEDKPRQLFISYVKSGMANKYGRLDDMVNDAGIFYYDGQARYILVCLTKELDYADSFLQMLNLRISEWNLAQAY